MTGVVDERVPRLDPIVALILVIDFAFVVPIGLVLAAIGLVGNVSYWDGGDRALAVGFGLAIAAAFIGVGLGILRSNVLGRPAVRKVASGIQIGSEQLRWAERRDPTGARGYGSPRRN